MNVSCLQENLQRGLAHVTRAVATKSTLPVLGNILLATDRGQLKLAATNLEIAITCWVGCQIEEEGALTVPARLLADFIGSLPNDRVSLQVDRRTQALLVRCARAKATIKGIDAEDFPVIPTVEDAAPTARIEPELLREIIGQVVFAAATDDSRPVLTGVQVRIEGNHLTMAAADGFRLSVRAAELAEPAQTDVDIIVPARALSELARTVADQPGPVEITVTGARNQALFRAGNIDFVSRLIEGAFPDYRKIIPKDYTTRSVLDTQEFLSATKRASYFARDNADIVKLMLTPSEADLTPGNLTIAANAAEVGDNASELDAAIEGTAGQIAFNVRYLSDVLTVVKSSQVALETQSASSPGVVRAVGSQDFTHVIMPMHLATR
ncbi:MAG: DNA polymerase III subunit beta [Chloroflexi bacterium]|nr:DNA polymerase III subunit beta [Chloroflexota bacterium]